MPKPVREVPWLDTRNGVYNIFWYEPPAPGQEKGRTKRLGLRTRDAATAAARLAAFITTGYAKAASAEGLTVSDALARYWKDHVEENVRAKARAEFARKHLEEFFGDTPLATIDKSSCRAFVEARRKGAVNGTKVGFATARRELIVLRAAANHAHGEKLIAAVPPFEIPAEVRSNRLAPWFTKDELARMFAKARSDVDVAAMLGRPERTRQAQRLLDFMTLAYWWGARKASVTELETSQVHFSEGLVNLHKDGDPITVKRRGVVPIFPEQRETLERLVQNAAGGQLFERNAAGQPYDPRHTFDSLCRACGVHEDKIKPHSLRHSRATHMLMDGEDIYKVAKLLHDTTATVERVYGHYSADWQLRK